MFTAQDSTGTTYSDLWVTNLTPTSINLSSYLNKDKLFTKYKSWVPRLFNSNRPQLEVPRMILHLPPPDAVVGTVAATDWHELRTSTSIQLIRFTAPRNLLLASQLLTLRLRRGDLHTVTVAITFVVRVLALRKSTPPYLWVCFYVSSSNVFWKLLGSAWSAR